MKNTTMRLLSLALCLVIVLGMFSGCSSTTPTGDTSADTSTGGTDSAGATDPADDPLINNEETINLTVFSQLAN